MQFNNKENWPVELEGKEYWISRSVAISVVLFFFNLEDQKWYLPLVKRWPAMPQEVGKYCLPCGYLDRNETAADAMRREVWEEIWLDLWDMMRKYPWVGNMQQPFHVDSSPNANRQNVLLEYFLGFSVENLPKVTNEHAMPEEIDEAIRLEVGKACKIDLAFSHELIVRERWEWIQRQKDLF